MRGKIQFENARKRLIPNNQIEGLQYWGDDEEDFHDLVPLHYRTTENMMFIKDTIGTSIIELDTISITDHQKQFVDIIGKFFIQD